MRLPSLRKALPQADLIPNSRRFSPYLLNRFTQGEGVPNLRKPVVCAAPTRSATSSRYTTSTSHHNLFRRFGTIQRSLL